MLDQIIEQRAREQQELGGIDVTKLKPNTKIEIKTKNGEYYIELLDNQGNVKIKGSRIPTPTNAYFSGSTWGGSIIKLHWIGFGMYMEFSLNDKPFWTDAVKTAKIIGQDWEFEFDWNSKLE